MQEEESTKGGVSSLSKMINFEFCNGSSYEHDDLTSIDDDEYVEYPLHNVDDIPCNKEEEERVCICLVMFCPMCICILRLLRRQMDPMQIRLPPFWWDKYYSFCPIYIGLIPMHVKQCTICFVMSCPEYQFFYHSTMQAKHSAELSCFVLCVYAFYKF